MIGLLEETPYVHVVDGDYWNGKICFSCFQVPKTPKRCTICEEAFYCSKECQIQDWHAGHKYECPIFQNAEEYGGGMRTIKEERLLRGVARMLAKFRKSMAKNKRRLSSSDQDGYVGEEFKNWPEGMKVRKLEDLVSNLNADFGEVQFCQDIAIGMEYFFNHFVQEKIFSWVTEPIFQHYAGVWLCNNIAIEKAHALEEFEVLGAGLYLQASRFDHTCTEPNFYRFFEGTKLFLKPSSSTTVSAETIDKQKINYISNCSLTSNLRRRDVLLTNYLFVCTCNLCMNDNMDAFKAAQLSKACPTCGYATMAKMPSGTLVNIENLIEIKKELENISLERGTEYCIYCDEPIRDFIQPELEDLIQCFERLEPRNLQIERDNCEDVLRSVHDAKRWINPRNVSYMYASIKIVQKYQLYLPFRDSAREIFLEMASTLSQILDDCEPPEALHACVNLKAALYCQQIGEAEAASDYGTKAVDTWTKLTHSGFRTVNECQEVLHVI